jgi:NAD(P)-dependent dehydrogenase (short-subunit alcohol dehydrogenase family)
LSSFFSLFLVFLFPIKLLSLDTNAKTIANGGIGFELTAQLLHDSKYLILLGSRSLEKGEAAVKLLQERGLPGKVQVLQIDVNSEASITNAQKIVEEKYSRLDALINNAAITSEEPTSASLSSRMTAAFQTNVTGPAVVVETFAPLLEKSGRMGKTPRIINVTSGAGSIGWRSDRTNPHQEMKAVCLSPIQGYGVLADEAISYRIVRLKRH